MAASVPHGLPRAGPRGLVSRMPRPARGLCEALLVLALAGDALAVAAVRMHALEDIALPSLLSVGCVCRIRSVHGGEKYLAHQPGGGLELASPAAHSCFWLQAVESEVAQLAERAGSPTATPSERITCHLVPIGDGRGPIAREYVSLQQDAPTTTSAIATSVMVAAVKDRPWLRFEGLSKEPAGGVGGQGRRALSVGFDGKLEVKTAEEGGNPLQKLVRMIRGCRRRTAFDIEVLESSLVGDPKLAEPGVHRGTWLPRWSACVHALQMGLGMELTLTLRGTGSESDVFTLTSQGVLCNGRDPVWYGNSKVRRVFVEPCPQSLSHGLLVAELAAPAASDVVNEGKISKSGRGKEVSLKRFIVVDQQGLTGQGGSAVRLMRGTSVEQQFVITVEALPLRYDSAVCWFACGLFC